MRLSKPAPGKFNVRKLTPSEARTLNLNKQLANKLRIMTNADGTVFFGFYKNKSAELVRYAEYSQEYFDEALANAKLEQYWLIFSGK